MKSSNFISKLTTQRLFSRGRFFLPFESAQHFWDRILILAYFFACFFAFRNSAIISDSLSRAPSIYFTVIARFRQTVKTFQNSVHSVVAYLEFGYVPDDFVKFVADFHVELQIIATIAVTFFPAPLSQALAFL